jgi:hypothetical protein
MSTSTAADVTTTNTSNTSSTLDKKAPASSVSAVTKQKQQPAAARQKVASSREGNKGRPVVTIAKVRIRLYFPGFPAFPGIPFFSVFRGKRLRISGNQIWLFFLSQHV